MSYTPLERFVETYQGLNKDNLNTLRALYSADIEFVDNLHHLHGFDALLHYFERQYSNLTHCQFHILDIRQSQESAWVTWEMDFAHPQLNSGQVIRVDGASHLRLNETIYYHRDYFDMGAVLYEHLPVMGKIVCWIKNRAAQ